MYAVRSDKLRLKRHGLKGVFSLTVMVTWFWLIFVITAVSLAYCAGMLVQWIWQGFPVSEGAREHKRRWGNDPRILGFIGVLWTILVIFEARDNPVAETCIHVAMAALFFGRAWQVRGNKERSKTNRD